MREFERILRELFPERTVRVYDNGAKEDAFETVDWSAFSIVEIPAPNGKKDKFITKISKEVKGDFEVENPSAKEITHLTTDYCFFMDGDEQRCDSLLFDDEAFAWIEFKLEVKNKNTAEHVKSGLEQVISTVQWFSMQSEKLKFLFQKNKMNAYICLQTFPRNDNLKNARMAKWKAFLSGLSCEGDLHFDNKVVWE